MLPFLVPILFTFYIQVCSNLKENSGAKGLIPVAVRSSEVAPYSLALGSHDKTSAAIATRIKVSAPVRNQTSVVQPVASHFTDRPPCFTLKTENYPHYVLQNGTDANRLGSRTADRPARSTSTAPHNEFITAG